jgi:hypothetical protein
VKITKRQLRRIIKEERQRLLREITPGEAGIAAMGGGDPASQGSAAVAADARADARGGLRTFEFTVTLRGEGLDEAEAWLDAVEAFCHSPGDPDMTLTYEIT